MVEQILEMRDAKKGSKKNGKKRKAREIVEDDDMSDFDF